MPLITFIKKNNALVLIWSQLGAGAGEGAGAGPPSPYPLSYPTCIHYLTQVLTNSLQYEYTSPFKPNSSLVGRCNDFVLFFGYYQGIYHQTVISLYRMKA